MNQKDEFNVSTDFPINNIEIFISFISNVNEQRALFWRLDKMIDLQERANGRSLFKRASRHSIH